MLSYRVFDFRCWCHVQHELFANLGNYEWWLLACGKSKEYYDECNKQYHHQSCSTAVFEPSDCRLVGIAKIIHTNLGIDVREIAGEGRDGSIGTDCL